MTPGRYIAIGLALVTALVGIVLLINSGSVARLEGDILQVRSVATDTRAVVVIMDARITNPGRTLFMVKDVSVLIETADNQLLEAESAPEPDIDRLLNYHKLAGPRYNPTLKSRQRIDPGVTNDYTIAAAFALTEEELASRRALRIKIADVDGAIAEIVPRR
jgi:hypothetical protein